MGGSDVAVPASASPCAPGREMGCDAADLHAGGRMTFPSARRPVGRTRLELPVLGLGTAPLGNLYRAITDAQAGAVIDAALDAGLRYVDTAPYYGFGLSERRVGQAL